MKNLIEQQNKEFDAMRQFNGVLFANEKEEIKDFISKIRKETAEAVCDEMIKGRVEKLKIADYMCLTYKQEVRVGEENCIGYYSRIAEEIEIKQQILKKL